MIIPIFSKIALRQWKHKVILALVSIGGKKFHYMLITLENGTQNSQIRSFPFESVVLR
jgi:hypothetical protein